MTTGTLAERLGRPKVERLAVYLALGDSRVPWTAKALAVLVAGYAFSPIDLIPDFIPVIGLLDDLLILPIGIYCVRCLIPETVMIDLRMEARTRLGRTKPVFWPAAAVILLIWLGIGILLARWLTG